MFAGCFTAVLGEFHVKQALARDGLLSRRRGHGRRRQSPGLSSVRGTVVSDRQALPALSSSSVSEPVLLFLDSLSFQMKAV